MKLIIEDIRYPSTLTRTVPEFVVPVSLSETLDCSPPTKANQVQSPADSLRISASENLAGRCHWSESFLEDLPFPLHFNSGAAPYSTQSSSSAPLLRAT
ncbi:hypothetical protein PR048_017905 [Dryococelus australis]|uniref:Uncharacterized protein n=1 Tax=Dryococelus australis TaxID=614101 RepID=A0ABQ9HAX3_9NEOP|nr:hypothetical protein PR048_017905 [Dryococelus australis]